MNPAEITFTAEESRGKGCRGCLFEGERSTVCYAACDEAVKRGLPDCDAPGPHGRSVIYVAVPVDPRQRDLFDAPRFVTGESACACHPGCCELPAHLCRDWVKRGMKINQQGGV